MRGRQAYSVRLPAGSDANSQTRHMLGVGMDAPEEPDDDPDIGPPVEAKCPKRARMCSETRQQQSPECAMSAANSGTREGHKWLIGGPRGKEGLWVECARDRKALAGPKFRVPCRHAGP